VNSELVLAEAAAKGVTLMLSGGKILYHGPPAAVTDDLLARLREHKVELLQLLASTTTMHTDYGTEHLDAPSIGPLPRPAVDWPPDLALMLRRVSTAFEGPMRTGVTSWPGRDVRTKASRTHGCFWRPWPGPFR
jgi:hypothetical protein